MVNTKKKCSLRRSIKTRPIYLRTQVVLNFMNIILMGGRRLNITLQCLDMSTDVNDFVEICCQLHGQSSRDVFSRYFQWGQMQRRVQKKGQGGKLSLLN